MNCWEFLKCPVETHEDCPAYPDKGTKCWKITGTKCDQGRIRMASIVEKIGHCRTCDFYIEYAEQF